MKLLYNSRKKQKKYYLSKDTTKILMHFNNSNNITQDECGNKWNIVGSPVSSSNNTNFGKSLYVDAYSYLYIDGGFDIGGGDFSIDFWLSSTLNGTTNSGLGGHPFAFCTNVQYSGVPSCHNTKPTIGLLLAHYDRWSGMNQGYSFYAYDSNNGVERIHNNILRWNDSVNQHIAICYSHDEEIFYIFVDGILCDSVNRKIERTHYPYFFIGHNPLCGSQGQGDFSGYIEEFCVVDGECRWKEDFIPPTVPYELV